VLPAPYTSETAMFANPAWTVDVTRVLIRRELAAGRSPISIATEPVGIPVENFAGCLVVEAGAGTVVE
jgi:hypothetical protein